MAADFQRESDFPFDVSNLHSQIGGRLKWGTVIVALILVFAALTFARSVYTDWLWFDQLGFKSVFLKILVTRIALFVIGAIVFGVLVSVALYFANKVSQGPEELPLPQATRDFFRVLIRWGTVAAIFVLSAGFGAVLSGQWELFLKFQSGAPFGKLDPVYGKDVAFYVFSLPLYDYIQGWVLGAAIALLVASLALCFVNFSFRGVGFLFTPGLKVLVSVIVAVIMIIVGVGHWIDRWNLLLSGEGVVFGATYADINARKPALCVLTVIAFAASVLILINGYMRRVRLLVGGFLLWAGMAIVLGTVWPNAIQRLSVNPNELSKESEYIERNIQFTRAGFGLDAVTVQSYPVEPSLSAQLISENLQTIDNIRLWDRGPLSNVYSFEQIIRPYYDFKEADVDRYVVDGEYRQVMLSAREVAPEKLEEASQTWINRKLVYTHGFGVAMSPVTEFTAKGRPEYFAKDIPDDGVIAIRSQSSDGPSGVAIDNPRLYYGENTLDYVFVITNTKEVDYQAGDAVSPQRSTYAGSGGVPIGSFISRLAYAWQMGDVNILISAELTSSTRIQYRRQIQERISSIAPFLRLDQDPYVVAADGQLFWVQDAYTATDHYPYSEPTGEAVDGGAFNYIRNSVKVTVDAFNGTVRFYVWDVNDPLVTTYQAIFPRLFLGKDEMPPSLATHVRYPQDLFGFQAAKYLLYHMQVPQDFYNREDIWSLPREKFEPAGELVPLDPYYVIMKIPGDEREEFVLLLPYTRNEPNPIMAGWLAARNDGDRYGELLAFNFPKERQVKGPEQIEADIDADEVIKEWFTLKCQIGAFCRRGNLLVIPIANPETGTFGLMYAEPIYLQAEGVVFPQLKKVILATDLKVVMENSVDEAIEALTGFTRAAAAAPFEAKVAAPGGEGATATEPATEKDRIQAGIDKLSGAMDELSKGFLALEEAVQSLKEELAGEQ